VSKPAQEMPGKFLGKVTVEAGGLLPLTPQVLHLLDIKSGDYVYLKADSNCLELHKVCLKTAPLEHRLA